MKIKASLVIGLICFLLSAFNVLAGPVPDTGQKTCFDEIGRAIPCPVDETADYYGQDAQYIINPPSYTKLDSSGNVVTDNREWVMVQDNITGLVWEVKQNRDGIQDYSNPHDADNTYTWYDSNPDTNGGVAGTSGAETDTEDFIDALNSANFGGHSDWRLPSVIELKTIGYNDRFAPAIDVTCFPQTAWAHPDIQDISYWTGTTFAAWSMRYLAYAMDFSGQCRTGDTDGRNIHLSNKIDHELNAADKYCVRAVRGEPILPDNHLIDNQDGTVTDTFTGLMWAKYQIFDLSWKEALAYCENLNLEGYTDWRVPTDKEMHSIADYSRISSCIYEPFRSIFIYNYHWSSSTLVGKSDNAWQMCYNFGYLYDKPKSENSDDYQDLPVLPVRGGQNQIPGHLLILAPCQAEALMPDDNYEIIWDTAGIPGMVDILLSTDGGRTFSLIIENTQNDGSEIWTVPNLGTGAAVFNLMLKITPRAASYTHLGTVQGLFILTCYSAIVPDADGDGVPNQDEDINHNGIVNSTEADPCDPDTDDDGLNDGDEMLVYGTKPYAVDSDGDGIDDNTELAYYGAAWSDDPDNDGLWNLIDPDADNDKLPDGWELDNGFNPVNPDDGNDDPDDDGLTTGEEYEYGTDYLNIDTDNDGIQDGTELGITECGPTTDCEIFQPDLDPTTTTYAFYPDSDNDGIIEGQEDLNANGQVDEGERDPFTSELQFSANSYHITHPLLPFERGRKLTLQYEDASSIVYNRYYEAVAVEEISSVKCLKVVIKGDGVHPNPEDDPNWMALWLAQDTDNSVWILQIYTAENNNTTTLSAEIPALFIPVLPVDGWALWPLGYTMETGVTVPQMSTGMGPYGNCLSLTSPTGDMLFLAPDVGLVKETMPGDIIWELMEIYQDGQLLMNRGTAGLFLYDGTTTQLPAYGTSDDPDHTAAFGNHVAATDSVTGVLWDYEQSAGWTQLTTDPNEDYAEYYGNLAVDMGTSGIFLYNGTPPMQAMAPLGYPANPENMVPVDGNLAATDSTTDILWGYFPCEQDLWYPLYDDFIQDVSVKEYIELDKKITVLLDNNDIYMHNGNLPVTDFLTDFIYIGGTGTENDLSHLTAFGNIQLAALLWGNTGWLLGYDYQTEMAYIIADAMSIGIPIDDFVKFGPGLIIDWGTHGLYYFNGVIDSPLEQISTVNADHMVVFGNSRLAVQHDNQLVEFYQSGGVWTNNVIDSDITASGLKEFIAVNF